MSSLRSLALALLPTLLTTPLAARAQPAPAGTAAAPAAAPGPQLPRITRVLVGSATDLGVDAESRPAHLGLWLTLDVAGLDQLVEKARAAKKPLQLYLNGMPLGDVSPVYLVSVYLRLDMPDFDNQLLALMGISNGTYLGFKLPEKAA
jgi:hypothetical protein